MRHLLALTGLSLLLLWPTTGRAQPKKQFAHFFSVQPAAVKTVQGYELLGVRDYTHMLVGQYTHKGGVGSGMVLLTCGKKQCRGKRVWLEPGDSVRLHKMVDLEGRPTSLHTRPSYKSYRQMYEPLGKRRRRLRWPALVVEVMRKRTATGMSRFSRTKIVGTEIRNQLYVISLRKRDKFNRVFQELTTRRSPSGYGNSNRFELVKATRRGRVLDILATRVHHPDNRSHCLPPKPSKHRYMLDRKRTRFVEKRSLGKHHRC